MLSIKIDLSLYLQKEESSKLLRVMLKVFLKKIVCSMLSNPRVIMNDLPMSLHVCATLLNYENSQNFWSLWFSLLILCSLWWVIDVRNVGIAYCQVRDNEPFYEVFIWLCIVIFSMELYYFLIWVSTFRSKTCMMGF